MRSTRQVVAVLLALGCAPLPGQQPDRPPSLPVIAPSALRAHVSFLASDALEGRYTPSRGLDIAAEYLAAQFRRIELEPLGDDGYFQTARYQVMESASAARIRFFGVGGEIAPAVADAVVQVGPACRVERVPVRVQAVNDDPPHAREMAGKAVVMLLPEDPAGMGVTLQRLRQVLRQVERHQPALIVTAGDLPASYRFPRKQLLFPPNRPPVLGVPLVHVRGAAAAQLRSLLKGGGEVLVSADWGEARRREVVLRNVVGRLAGSDPKRKDSAVLVSAHYDHIGMLEEGAGDRIYNGANDDASGAAAVIEIAAALGAAPRRPPRSVIFALFFGEELGMLGSKHYAAHPPFPLAATIAGINLEHMGRTDADGADSQDAIFITGHNYSTVSAVLAAAAAQTGFVARRSDKHSDAFFPRSDNIVFARLGIPAHTICTGFLFPDYHQPGDHWEKLNYPNMARATQTVALAAALLAGNPEAPAWNRDEPGAEPFRKARERLMAAPQP